jgi:hypothetical protein
LATTLGSRLPQTSASATRPGAHRWDATTRRVANSAAMGRRRSYTRRAHRRRAHRASETGSVITARTGRSDPDGLPGPRAEACWLPRVVQVGRHLRREAVARTSGEDRFSPSGPSWGHSHRQCGRGRRALPSASTTGRRRSTPSTCSDRLVDRATDDARPAGPAAPPDQLEPDETYEPSGWGRGCTGRSGVPTER